MKFNEWIVLREGKTEKDRQAYNDFINGKTDKLKLPSKPVARGHQSHISGAGAHDDRPRKERTRSGQRRAWQKEQE